MGDDTEITPHAATATDLAALADQQFILLTTFRRSGVAVPTTIWFVNAGDRLYFQTGPEAGKLKRIRANGLVTIAPSTRNGETLGPALIAQARLLGQQEAADADAALHAKYGEARTRLMEQMGHAGRTMERAYIAIEVAP